MAMVTVADVQQRLGLVDDATTELALLVRYTGTDGVPTYTKTATSFVLLIDAVAVTGGTFDLTSTTRDTLQELASGIAALADWQATVIASNSTASNLLTNATAAAIPEVATGVYQATISYSNTASGTSAAVLSTLIAEVEAAICLYCGVDDFEYGARDEYYDGHGGKLLLLRHYPVYSITSVSWVDSAGTETAYASGTYRLDGKTGRVAMVAGAPYSFEDGTTGWPRGFQNIRVQYNGGPYRLAGADPTTDVPDGLKGVVIDMVTDAFLSRRASGEVGASGAGDSNVTYRSVPDLLALHAHRLAPYVRVRTAS